MKEKGFLREVTSVSTNGNTLTIETIQANMEDVFKNAAIEFVTDLPNGFGPNNNPNRSQQGISINYLKEGLRLSSDGFEYEFLDLLLYENGPVTFGINGNARFNPNFSFKGDYSFFGGLEYLDFRADNATLSLDCTFSLNASDGESIPEFNTTLADYDKKITVIVGGIPVVIMVNTKLEATLNAGIEAQIGVSAGFTSAYTLSTNTTYENDSWTGDFSLAASVSAIPFTLEGQVNLSQNLTITPRVSLKFYGIIGPYCQPEMTEDFGINLASPSLDWDSELKAGLDITTGVDIEILGKTLLDFNRVDSFEESIWNAPNSVGIISGNNQTSEAGQELPEPLKVKVTDNFGNAVPLVNVYFTPADGSGSVNNEIVMTDENGFAEVIWTIGIGEEQTVEVTVEKADGSSIENGTVNFTATAEAANFIYEGDWYLKTFNDNPDGTFYLYWENLFVFDSTGFAPNTLWWSDIAGSTEWLVSENSYNLIYHSSNSSLELRNNYWGTSIYLIVNSIDDVVFYSDFNDPDHRYELYRQ